MFRDYAERGDRFAAAAREVAAATGADPDSYGPSVSTTDREGAAHGQP
jgi:hypothetical protein